MRLDSCYSLWKHRYTLRRVNGTRYGALLRVLFPDQSIGYADIHPWPERGDAPLQQQLTLLQRGTTTSLTKRSLSYAQKDAKARKGGVSLFAGEGLLPNHYFISSLDRETGEELDKAFEKGFRTGKIKISPSTLSRLFSLRNRMPSSFQIRLDAQSTLQEEDLLHIAESFGDQVAYVEDPFPYDPKRWKKMQAQLPFALAADVDAKEALGNPAAAKTLVVKPAIHDLSQFTGAQEQNVVVTSYLDHPVGQIHALAEAVRYKVEDPCGCASHLAYAPNIFSRTLRFHRDRLIPPEGTGIGWDAQLESLSWEPL